MNRKADVSRKNALRTRQHTSVRAHHALKNRLQVQRWIVGPIDRDLVGGETNAKRNTVDLDGWNRNVAPVTRHAPVFRKQRHKELTAEQHLVVNRRDTP